MSPTSGFPAPLQYGEVFDRGYAHYDGRRQGRLAAWWSLTTYSMKRALGLRKRWTAKVLPFCLYVAAIIPVVVLVAAGLTEVDHNDIDDNDVGIAVLDTAQAMIDHNKISDSTDDGIELLGTTTQTTVSHNDSSNNGLDGIFVDSSAQGNLMDHNTFKKNGNLDAEDLSIGTGTGGTANTWVKNKGKTDNRGGLLVS